MSGYTLTWKNLAGASLCPGDGSFLRPDTLRLLKPAELAAFPVQVGRTKVALSELFEIRGEPPAPAPASTSATVPAPEGPSILQLEGLPPWDRLGAGMTGGELIIDGDVGHDLGASMTGGRIHVHGRAGHRVGGPDYTSSRGMTGGEIVIDGDAGDYAGLRMRRGLIAIRGHAGASPGFRMIAGTVVVGHGPLNAPGLEMRRGTVLGLGRGRDAGKETLPHLAVVGRVRCLGHAIPESLNSPAHRVGLGHRSGGPYGAVSSGGGRPLRVGQRRTVAMGELNLNAPGFGRGG